MQVEFVNFEEVSVEENRVPNQGICPLFGTIHPQNEEPNFNIQCDC